MTEYVQQSEQPTLKQHYEGWLGQLQALKRGEVPEAFLKAYDDERVTVITPDKAGPMIDAVQGLINSNS